MLKKLNQYKNIFFALVLIFSGLSRLINPSFLWFPAFIGIAFPFVLHIVLLQFIVWGVLFKNKKLMLLIIFSIAISWYSIKTTFSISVPSRSINEISLLTWNVKNFDLYNWSKNEETHELMMKFLEEKSPDVLCIQEFYTENYGKFKNIKEIKKRLGYKYYYFGETFNIKKNKKWGLVTFSKFPIINKGQIKFEKGSRLNSCIYTDIAFSNDTIYRIYNTHLQSLHFANKDYEYLKELQNEQKANIEGSLKIAKKIKKGFIKRAKQAELIKKNQNNYKGKSIICGDFNDTPSSFAYHVLSKNMQDAFSKKGFGFGNTLVNPTPFFRIDFVLMDKKLKINDFNTYKKTYSDHYPVQVYFEL